MDISGRWIFSWRTFLEKNCTWQSDYITCILAATHMSHDRDFNLFTELYINSNPSSIWKIPENYREIELCKFICKLYTTTRLNGDLHTCILCNTSNSFFNVFQHSSCSCPSTAMICENWRDVIVNCFDVRLSAELCWLLVNDLFLVLLGRPIIHESDNKAFCILNFKLIRSTEAEYYRSTSGVFHTWGHVHLCIYRVTITLYLVLIFLIHLFIFPHYHYLCKCISLMWLVRKFMYVLCSI